MPAWHHEILTLCFKVWTVGSVYRDPMSSLNSPDSYPSVEHGSAVDDFHGTLVADPFRILEDADDPVTQSFVADQNLLSRATLDAIATRESIRSRLAEKWTYPQAGVPFSRRGRWFQWRNSGQQNQPVLWVMSAPVDEGEVLLDPNELSPDGTVAIGGLSVSPDGELVAYALSEAGSDWQTWRVRSVATREDLVDTVTWSKFSNASWLPDASGFFYGAPDRPDDGDELSAQVRGLRILLHRLGTAQEEDEVIFAPSEPDWLPDHSTTADGRFLVIAVQRGTDPANRLFVIDLSSPSMEAQVLTDTFEWASSVVASSGDALWVLTDCGADRRRILRAERRPDGSFTAIDTWSEVIGEQPAMLMSAVHCGNRLVCHYLADAHSELRVYRLDGSFDSEISLPGVVTVGDAFDRGSDVSGDPDDAVIVFNTTSFLQSGTLWRHDLESHETTMLRAGEADLDESNYVTELLMATSADGTRVPVFCSHRRDVEANGEVPVWLYGYGGFNIPLTPSFSVPVAVWLERGGVFAMAVLRGGGEYGTAWHDAGRLANKQNVFDDFAACARLLVETGWTRPERIAINGASNGGLLVGACLNQHPELYGAAIAQVGVMDMLRFHRFTIGWAWASDYGLADDPEQFAWLIAYSPLHNVRSDASYPPVLVMTGDHDDRVVPGHSLKYVATLLEAVRERGVGGPILLRVATSAGHGAGKPIAMRIDEAADMLAFMEASLG